MSADILSEIWYEQIFLFVLINISSVTFYHEQVSVKRNSLYACKIRSEEYYGIIDRYIHCFNIMWEFLRKS
jgi:hypothetical protein